MKFGQGTVIKLILFLALASVCRAELSIIDQWPANGATNVCADAPLRVTFNQMPVLGGKGRVLVYHLADGKLADVIDLGAAAFTNNVGGRLLHYHPIGIDGNVVSLRLHAHTLAFGESYRAQIEPGALKDTAGNDFKGLGGDAPWTFTIKNSPAKGAANYIVAADGSGDFCTMQGAVDFIPDDNMQTVRVFLRNGAYDGMIYLQPGKDHIHLTGEDRNKAVLSGVNNDLFNPSRMGRALVSIDADDFVAENLTIHNTTPYHGSQAEALRVNGDKCVLRNCDFLSFQDTLLLSGRVYVTNCYVEGDVDFIWGQGVAFFENCEIKAVHDGYYLQSRSPGTHPGYVFLNCKLTAAPGVNKCWLARIDSDRFPHSQAAFIHCSMGPHIPPAGWQVTDTNQTQLGFLEYQSTGLDAQPLDIRQRHPASRQISGEEAAAMSDPAQVFSFENNWNPRTASATSNAYSRIAGQIAPGRSP